MSAIKLRGRAFRLGHWIGARQIMGDRTEPLDRDEAELDATLVLPRIGVKAEDDFSQGDVLVADRGFGHGAADDEPALLLALAGVGAVLAETIDPAFRHSLLRLGVPVMVIPGASRAVATGDDVILDFEAGLLEVLASGKVHLGTPPTPRERQLVTEAAGLRLLDPEAAEAEDPDVLEVPGRPRRPPE